MHQAPLAGMQYGISWEALFVRSRPADWGPRHHRTSLGERELEVGSLLVGLQLGVDQGGIGRGRWVHYDAVLKKVPVSWILLASSNA